MRTLATLSFVACAALPASGRQGGETDRWAEFEYGAWTGDESPPLSGTAVGSAPRSSCYASRPALPAADPLRTRSAT